MRTSPATRLITIDLFATLTMADGRTVMDDPAVFPPFLLPFARAHARELPALRRLAPALDWLVLTPPAGLRPDAPAGVTGYVLAEPPFDRRLFDGVLGYGQLACAAADQIETPTVHQRDADDELDQVVRAQVRAGGSGPLGVGQQVGRGTPDDAVAVDGGRVGVWTFAFDGQPAGRVREAAAEIEELGYGAIWYGEAGVTSAVIGLTLREQWRSLERRSMAVGVEARVLLVSGSTREGSTNTAALRTARAVAPDGVVAELYDGLVELPAFVPGDHEPVHPAVAELRRRVGAADAVLFCTPEYAGSLPGSLKNLLDWTVGSGELYGKPVAWVNVAAEGRGGGADAALATVLGYVGAVVVTGGPVRISVGREAVGPDGLVGDGQVRTALGELLGRLAALAGTHV